jgi:Glycosyl transferase family 90
MAIKSVITASTMRLSVIVPCSRARRASSAVIFALFVITQWSLARWISRYTWEGMGLVSEEKASSTYSGALAESSRAEVPSVRYNESASLTNTSRSAPARVKLSETDQLLQWNRFPSLDERIRIYLGKWYHPPCSDKDFFRYRFISGNQLEVYPPLYHSPAAPIVVHIDTVPRLDTIFHASLSSLQQCAANSSHSVQTYCSDVLLAEKGLVPLFNKIISDGSATSKAPPLLMQFGDSESSQSHLDIPIIPPHFRKFRRAFPVSDSDIDIDNNSIAQADTCVSYQASHSGNILTNNPLIWNLNIDRHYGNLPLVDKNDIPWSHKLNRSVFWGAPTGATDIPVASNSTDSSTHNHRGACRSIPRCRLVYDSARSTLVTAKFVRTRDRFPNVIDNITMVGHGRLTLKQLLQYKGILAIQGNDVASSLKWALFSQSVVLMPPPTFVSFAMEDWLIPWVHYIPLASDLSDVESKTQWMLDHPKEAQIIALQGRAWMHNLWVSEQAKNDRKKIEQEVIQRYLAHWKSADE